MLTHGCSRIEASSTVNTHDVVRGARRQRLRSEASGIAGSRICDRALTHHRSRCDTTSPPLSPGWADTLTHRGSHCQFSVKLQPVENTGPRRVENVAGREGCACELNSVYVRTRRVRVQTGHTLARSACAACADGAPFCPCSRSVVRRRMGTRRVREVSLRGSQLRLLFFPPRREVPRTMKERHDHHMIVVNSIASDT
jgi:hypothetical protein